MTCHWHVHLELAILWIWVCVCMHGEFQGPLQWFHFGQCMWKVMVRSHMLCSRLASSNSWSWPLPSFWNLEAHFQLRPGLLLQSAWAWLSNDLLVSCEKYAQAIGRFISVALNNVDMQKWNLVGIGHSIGANVMWVPFPLSFILSDNNSLILKNTQPTPIFLKLVIVEPIASTHRPEPYYNLHDKLVERVKKWQTLWQSREDLKRVFTNPNHSIAKWDPHVLDSFAISHFF